jgi:hypothetical protein
VRYSGASGGRLLWIGLLAIAIVVVLAVYFLYLAPR